MSKLKQTLVLHEKYGDIYLDVSTDKQLHKAALSVIKARFGGDNPRYLLQDPVKPQEPSIPLEKVDKLKPASLKNAVVNEWKQYERNWNAYKIEVENNELIRKCLETGNGKLAYLILEMRNHYEYERFSLESVSETYGGA